MFSHAGYQALQHGHPLLMEPITLGELARAAAAGRWATIATRGLTNAKADKESADCAGLRPALLLDFLAV